MNEVGLTCERLCSAKEVCKCVDQGCLLDVCNDKGSRLKVSACLQTLDTGCYQLQLSAKNSSRCTKEYAVSLTILTKQIEYTNPTQEVTYLVDNHCKGKFDVDNGMNNEEETILSSFLGSKNSSVISLIKIKA